MGISIKAVVGSKQKMNVLNRDVIVMGIESDDIDDYELQYRQIENIIERGNFSRCHAKDCENSSDYSEAVKWYRRAIGDCNLDALCDLAWLLLSHNDLIPDTSFEPRKLFLRAARNSVSEGYYGLGYFEEMKGDIERALKYYIDAAKMNNQKAKEKLEQYLDNNANEHRSGLQSTEAHNEKLALLYQAALLYDETAFRELLYKTNRRDLIGAEACFLMGRLFDNITKCSASPISAKWYGDALDKGYDPADIPDYVKKRREIHGKSVNRENTCPLCGSYLRMCKGQYGGYFKGCSRYPSCRYTANSSTPLYGSSRNELKYINLFHQYAKK